MATNPRASGALQIIPVRCRRTRIEGRRVLVASLFPLLAIAGPAAAKAAPASAMCGTLGALAGMPSLAAAWFTWRIRRSRPGDFKEVVRGLLVRFFISKATVGGGGATSRPAVPHEIRAVPQSGRVAGVRSAPDRNKS